MPGPYPLATLVAQITPAGITAPAFEDILASLQASYRSIYGQDVDLAADTQDGQWVATQAEGVHEVNQAIIAAYFSYSPTWAQGAGLSAEVKINGIARNAASFSQAELLLVGVAGTQIASGLVADSFSNRWQLPPSVTIPAAGEITATAICQTLGAITAEPHTITQILTTVPGWQTADNLVSASPGKPVESDAQLRQRQARSTSLPAITPREAIFAAIADLSGVGRVAVYDNDTDDLDANEIPPHTIACVVEGGDDDNQIAQTIAYKKNTGCGTFGSHQIIVLDSHGVPNTINYFPLTERNIWVNIELQPLAGYLDTTGQLIQLAISAFVAALAIGETVYAAWLMSPANLAGDAALAAAGGNLTQPQLDALSATYVVRALWLGFAANPTADADLPITFTSAAFCPVGHVTIDIVTGP